MGIIPTHTPFQTTGSNQFTGSWLLIFMMYSTLLLGCSKHICRLRSWLRARMASCEPARAEIPIPDPFSQSLDSGLGKGAGNPGLEWIPRHKVVGSSLDYRDYFNFFHLSKFLPRYMLLICKTTSITVDFQQLSIQDKHL